MIIELRCVDESFNDMTVQDVISELLANGYRLTLTPQKYDQKKCYSIMVDVLEKDDNIFFGRYK